MLPGERLTSGTLSSAVARATGEDSSVIMSCDALQDVVQARLLRARYRRIEDRHVLDRGGSFILALFGQCIADKRDVLRRADRPRGDGALGD